MGVVTGQFTLLSEETGKVITAFETLAGTIAGPEGTTEVVEDATTIPGDIQGPPKPPTETQIAHWSDITVYDTLGKMFAAAGQQIRKGLTAKAGSAEHTQAMKDYTELTGGPGGPGSLSVFEGIKRKFEAMEHLIPKTIQLEKESRQDLVEAAIGYNDIADQEFRVRQETAQTSEQSATDSATSFTGIAETVKQAYLKVQAWMAGLSMSAGMRSMGGSGNRPWHENQTGKLQDAINASKIKHAEAWKRALNPNKKQHGGMINEPIWGIGKSGQSYMFGEAGPERVIPTGASTRCGVGDVTINVNVDSINSDVDLEKIKPVIERALQEVHSRRGII